jgi:hypothetical protein
MARGAAERVWRQHETFCRFVGEMAS